MDIQQHRQQVRHYEEYTPQEIKSFRTGQPENQKAYLRQIGELPVDLRTRLLQGGNLREDGTYDGLWLRGQNWFLEQWQLVKDENGKPVQIPAEASVRRSTFEEIMQISTCCGQKQNEQKYREEIGQIFARLKRGVPERYDEADFLSLAGDERLIEANSDSYNNVLQAAEHFHRRLLRGDLEEKELVSAAEKLHQACADYIAGHPAPFFEDGKRRLLLIASLKKKAEDVIWDERVRNGVAELSVEQIGAQEGGEQRWNKFAEIVKTMIQSWNGQGDEALVASIKHCVLGNLESSTEKFMRYFFPETVYNVHDGGEQKDQIWGLQAVELSRRGPIIRQFMSAIGETMGDIVFWAEKLGAETVSEVQLTGSDFHERGIGVVIVTFKSKTGVQKKVLKPEERWAEYKLLGKNPEGAGRESLAECLNRFAKAGQIKIKQPDGKFKALESKIRTIEMQMADGHGTMAEMVEHIQEEKLLEVTDGNINAFLEINQILLSQLFFMLVGMGDMHHENFVFEKDGPNYRGVMIDADNALSSQMLGQTTAGGQSRIIQNFLDGRKIIIEPVSELSDKIEEALSGVTLRTVPIATADLAGFRASIQRHEHVPEILQKMKDMAAGDLIRIIRSMDSANTPAGAEAREGSSAAEAEMRETGTLSAEEETPVAEEMQELNTREEEVAQEGITLEEREEQEKKAQAERELRSLLEDKQEIISFIRELSNGLGRVLANVDMDQEWQKAALICAIEDFISGQIPFYEFHPDSGTVTTHRGTVTIATARPLQALIEPVMQAVRPENAASVASQLIRPPQQE